MKTTVDIPDQALRDLMHFTKASTKREAIGRAIDDFNRQQRMAALARHAGTFRNFMTQDELARMRETRAS